MNIIDWNIIFKLKEFNELFFTKDIIQLSMCSKKFRKRLINDIFKTFNFGSFVLDTNYSSFFIREDIKERCQYISLFINPYKPITSELTESKNEFSNDLKIFNRNPTKLIVNDYGGFHYLLNEIPVIFPNITTLILNDSKFRIDTLQYLLDNFKSLENLELTENVVFNDAEIPNIYTIIYPISLRSLKLKKNWVMMVQDKINSIIVNGKLYGNSLYISNGIYQHLPNLTILDYDMECNWPEEDGDLFMFIRLNPQLKCLKLSGDLFNFELFDIIKDYENLTHFEFDIYYNWEVLENYEMPMLRNIKHLHLIINVECYDNIFIDNFPNVSELVIEDSGQIYNKYYDLIGIFENLKSLKIISLNNYDPVIELTLPKLIYLENLEFNFSNSEMTFENLQWDVSDCSNLKFITFTKDSIYAPFKKPNLLEELTRHWDLYYFPHKITLLKNSNKF